MTDTKVIIKQTFDQERIILLPEKNYPLFKHCTSIAFGSKKLMCEFSPYNGDAFLIPTLIWKELGLVKDRAIHFFYHENTIYLGPLVGVFTAGFTGSLLRPVGTRSLLFAKMLEVEQDVGVCSFVFGAHHIDWSKGTINGYFYSKKGWQQHEVPFPNVIYNRLPNRKTEAHEMLQDIKKKLQDLYGIPWFNHSFFHKWEIHEMFQNNVALMPHLPESIVNPTFRDIKLLIRKYRHIYLKPANGSLGLGIYQLLHSPEDDHYYCRYRTDEKNILRKYNSLQSLLSDIQKEKNLSSYIAQQGISLKRVDHKQMDFRIHTNKNRHGKWIMSAIASKIAGLGSVTTHLRSGGEIKTMEEIFPDRKKRKEILHRIEKIVIEMSIFLDQEISGIIGEIGFDIGIDKQDNIWLFEANSKPGRSIFKHPNLKYSDLLSRKLPMDYAIYLSEQTIRNPERFFEKELL